MSPASVAGAAASAVMPSRAAARHTSNWSRTGSAAAISSSRRVPAGRPSSRGRKPSSARLGHAEASGSPNPPASSSGVSAPARSSTAPGLPRLSATIRSRTCSSSGPATADASSVRASRSASPWTVSSGSPVRSCWPPDWRTAKTIAIGAAPRWRATNASACPEARSSQCALSTAHTSGRSAATPDIRLRTARPTARRSGAAPARMLNAVRSASRCGPGRRSIRSRNGAHSWCSPANASPVSDSTPTARAMRHPAACARRYSSSAVLPAPASPHTTSVRLCPARTSATRRLSASLSRRRPGSGPSSAVPGSTGDGSAR